MVNAVGALQRHVLARARTSSEVPFTNINQWIDANATNNYLTAAVGRSGDTDDSFRVLQEFATLSAQAGFTIDADNIS